MDQTNIVSRKHSDQKQEMADDLRRRQTEAEAILWREVRADKLGVKIRRQQIIDGFIVDFYCHASGHIFELDGGVHLGTKEYDRDRDAIIAARGLTIIRIPNERIINDLQGVLAEMREVISDEIDRRANDDRSRAC